MNNQQIIEKYYEREFIVKILTSYVLYYQVSLGHNVHNSIQNPAETIKKIEELNLTLDPNVVIVVMMEIILQYSKEDNFDKNFDNYIKINALLHSIKDFIENDKELINGKRIQEYVIKEIHNDSFFNSNLKMQYLKEYPDMYKYYDNLIDDEYVVDVQRIMLNNLNMKEKNDK